MEIEDNYPIIAAQISPSCTFSFDIQVAIEKPNQQYFESLWAEVQSFLHSIYDNSTRNTYSFAYFKDIVSNLCRNEFEANIYSSLRAFYDSKLKSTFLNLSLESEGMMDRVEEEWHKIKRCEVILEDVFSEFAMNYLCVTPTPTFSCLLMQSLSRSLNNDSVSISPFISALIDELINCFKDLRERREFNAVQMKDLMNFVHNIGAFERVFSPRYFECSQAFYNELLAMHRSSFDLRVYLAEIEHRLRQESEIALNFLSSKATAHAIVELVERTLVTGNLEQIFQSGFHDVMADPDLVHAKRIFTIMRKTGGLDFLKKNWDFYILKRGEAVVAGREKIRFRNANAEGFSNAIANEQMKPEGDNNQDDVFLHLLGFFHELLHTLQHAFENLPILRSAMNNALEQVVSAKTNALAELFSKHLDRLLNKSNKKLSDFDSVLKEVDEALELFRYLSAKDVFEAFYNKRLTRRMLMNLSYSIELERHVLDRVKKECGDQFTTKAEEILKDVNESKELNKYFNEHLLATKQEHLNQRNYFSVTVMSLSSWPMKSIPFKNLFFKPFNQIRVAFSEFYASKFKGVSLTWQFEASTCDIQALIGNSDRYVFQVQLVQALILLCFNTKEQLTYSEISNLLNAFEAEELKKNLVSLFAMKESQRLLKKSGELKKLEPSDIFEVNQLYSNKKKVVRINSLFKRESAEEVRETTNKVLFERGFVLDASIVKILKNKKSISHNDLLKELFQDLKLPINATDVKKRVEGLIEKDYIERDNKNLSLYHYIA